MINRRSVLKILGLVSFFGFWSRKNALAFRRYNLIFYIAGVRFQKDDPGNLSPGEELKINVECWQGNRCFGIYSKHGAKLGYVPAIHIKDLPTKDKFQATLVKVSRYSLPWKRYKVSILIPTKAS